MSSDLEVNDSLLRTIAELRSEVNHLIDEQVAFVKERVEEPVSPRVPAGGAGRERDRSSEGRSPRSGRSTRGQRLDALAKHLDHRLRLANVRRPNGLSALRQPRNEQRRAPGAVPGTLLPAAG